MGARGVWIFLRLRLRLLKNRWFGKKSGLSHDCTLAVVSLLIGGLLFNSFRQTLARAEGDVLVSQELSLYGFLAFYSVTIFVSGVVGALGSLFSHKDLDFILSAPLTTRELVFYKVCDVVSGSFWLLPVFGLPSVAAWTVVTHQSFLYFGFASAVVALIFVAAILASVAVALVIGSVLPLRQIKELFVGSIAIAFVTAILHFSRLSKGALPQMYKKNAPADVLLRDLSFEWPATWGSKTLVSALDSNIPSSGLVYLILTILLVLAVVHILWSLSYERALTRTRDASSWVRPRDASKVISRRLISILPSPTRAFLSKELKGFSRDLIQAVHFMLLLGSCVLYLYNLDALAGIDQLRDELKPMWSGVLALCNVVYGSLLVTAIVARFVFSSLSLEGNAFWLVQTSPLSLRDVLKIRLWIWFIPLSLVAAIIFSSGACAVGASFLTVIVSALAGPVMCYGIVATGVGLGAVYTDFDWDHSGRPQGSLRNVAFVFVSTLLCFLSLLPLSAAILVSAIDQDQTLVLPSNHVWIAVGSTLALMLLHALVGRCAVNFGVRRLERRLG